MRRYVAWMIVSLLVISLAAPAGAVFAYQPPETSAGVEVGLDSLADEEGPAALEVDDSEQLEVISEEVLEPEPDSSSSATEGVEVSTGGDPAEAVDLQSDDELPPQNDPPAESYPQLIISELQVSGVCDGGSWCRGGNVEFIELYNPNDFDVSLEGWAIRRQSTGPTSQPVNFVSFGHTGIFAGEYVLIAQGLVEPSELIISQLPSNLSDTGGSLFLVSPSGDVVDMVGWGTQAKSFYTQSAVAPGQNQSIQRCLKDGVMRAFDPRNNFEEMLIYADVGPTPGAGIECAEPPVINKCQGVVISEIAANVGEQFIELHNPTDQPVDIAGCQLQTNRSNTRQLVFESATFVEPGGYLVVTVEGTDLTLTKTTTGTVYLLSSDGLVEADSVDYARLSQDTSWSLIDGEWWQTYQLTPGADNVYLQFLPCEEGYWRNEATGRCNRLVEPAVSVDCGEGRERNPETGRCRNIPGPRELTPCRDGQYRSEQTNRCRSIATAVASVLKPCADDQFRNPLTNRCKKIASAEDVALADCGEGRERNPITNRCRNVLAATMPEAPFAPEEVSQVAEGTLGWWALGGVSLVALGYAGWQWRFEVGRAVRRIVQVFASGSKGDA